MGSGLRVFLTIDVGPDDAILGKGHGSDGCWERTEVGMSILCDVFRSIADEFDTGVAATWFLRADRLIADQFGDRLAIFKTFSSFTEERVVEGHEIGWMPQVYSATGSEIDHQDLSPTHAAIAQWGPAPRSVRMGDCFHDNRTMGTLSRLGVRFDSSAVPGRSKHDSGWRMDWIGTPREAYHPSVDDYRKPGTPQLDILEMPLSVFPVEAPHDASPLVRYLNPCMRRDHLWPNLRGLVASSAYLIGALHPDEIVPGKRGHPLIAYTPDELRFNLQELVGETRRLGREISFDVLEAFGDQRNPSRRS